MFTRTLVWLVNVAEPIFFLYLTVCIFVLLPMALFRRTRHFSVLAIMVGTWLSGGILWITSVAILYFNWGWSALIFGLVFAGIGVVPVAWVLSLIHWLQPALGDLAILTAGTFLPRLAVAWWISREAP